MGTKTTLISDISDSEPSDDDDVTTHTAVLDGDGVEFECLDSEWDLIRRGDDGVLATAFERGRRIKPEGRSRSRSRSASPSAGGTGAQGLTREQGRECRAWAREHGFEVSDRGRLPDDVIAGWKANDPGQVDPQRRAGADTAADEPVRAPEPDDAPGALAGAGV